MELMKKPPESAEVKEKPAGNKKLKRKRLLRRVIIIAIPVIVVAIAAIVLVSVFAFRIGNFAVSGNTVYPRDDVVAASGLSIGQNMLTVNYEDAASRIEQLLPYTDNVSVSRKGFSTIVIKTTLAEPAYAIQIADNYYVIATAKLKGLEMAETPPEGLTIIRGKDSTPMYELGKKVGFSNEPGNDSVQGIIEEITAVCEENEFTGFDLISVEDKANIYIIYDGRIVIRLGNSDSIAKKLILAKKAIDEENKMSSTQFGEMDVRVLKKAVFSPEDYKDMAEIIAFRESLLPPEEKPNSDEEDPESESSGENEEETTDTDEENTEESDENNEE